MTTGAAATRRPLDGWQRGRLHRFRKPASPHGLRGFKSHLVRQILDFAGSPVLRFEHAPALSIDLSVVSVAFAVQIPPRPP